MLTDIPDSIMKRHAAGGSFSPVSDLLLCVVIFLCAAHGVVEACEEEPIVIGTAFPGGNIIVERVEGDVVHLRPDLRDTEGWWFYWNFQVCGVAEGRMLTFDFGERSPIGVRGPAVSRDNGVTWDWLGAEQCAGSTFSYAFPQSGCAWFASTIPYLESDLRAFVKKWSGSSILVVEDLCESAAGRKVELLRAGCTEECPQFRALITARHHACETMANYVLEGILTAVLSDDEPGRWFQEHVEVIAVPFMDKDGVEEGDQGKNRRPHDHNRDYGGASIYSETAALKKRAGLWEPGPLQIAFDLHCPYIRGKGNEVIYLVGSANGEMWANQRKFAEILERVNDSRLPYQTGDNLPFGEGWNTDENYGGGVSFARWAESIQGIKLSTTIEFPYANAGGKEVSQESARAFGTSVARALRNFLMGHEQIR